MRQFTGDETADFLIRQIRFLGRVGSDTQKQSASRWERIVRDHVETDEGGLAASFATGKAPKRSKGGV
jgi:hypothetical protein